MDLLNYAYGKQHAGKDMDDYDLGLENNTVINDFYTVDEACSTMHQYKPGDKIRADRDLLGYFELVKNMTSEQKSMQKASFKLLQAARLYQRHRKVKRFIKY